MPEKPPINKKYKLEKFPGKGGWTYARLPEILQDKNHPFGWVKVRGFIDDYEIKQYHLMPMSSGHLFLPVKAAIRKKIGKKEGDWITVVLFPDEARLIVPEEIQLCLQDEPNAEKAFYSLPDGEKKYYIDWIYDAKKEETRTRRIIVTIERLMQGLRYYDKME